LSIVDYNELKKKAVVNILDGRKLGKVKNIKFTFPEGKVEALIVGENALFAPNCDYIVNLCCVNKIGDDAILVSLADGAAGLVSDDGEL